MATIAAINPAARRLNSEPGHTTGHLSVHILLSVLGALGNMRRLGVQRLVA
jgi:hypothetical protein